MDQAARVRLFKEACSIVHEATAPPPRPEIQPVPRSAEEPEDIPCELELETVETLAEAFEILEIALELAQEDLLHCLSGIT